MKYLIGFGLLAFCGVASAEPLSTVGFLLADTLLATGAGGAITGLTGLGTAAAGMAGSMIGSKLMGKKKAPQAAAPAVMPTSDDKAVQEARRRQIAAMQAGSGRASTILSDGGAKLGG